MGDKYESFDSLSMKTVTKPKLCHGWSHTATKHTNKQNKTSLKLMVHIKTLEFTNQERCNCYSLLQAEQDTGTEKKPCSVKTFHFPFFLYYWSLPVVDPQLHTAAFHLSVSLPSVQSVYQVASQLSRDCTHDELIHGSKFPRFSETKIKHLLQ